MTSGAGPEDVVAVERVEVGDLCLAALDAAGAGRRVAEPLTDAALFAEDGSTGPAPADSSAGSPNARNRPRQPVPPVGPSTGAKVRV